MKRSTFSLAAVAALALAALPAGADPPAKPAPVTAVWADDFVDSVGVNVHWSDPNSVYNRAYDKMKAKLAAAGIRHVRDGAIPDAYPRSADLYKTLGVRTTYIVGRREGGHSPDRPEWKSPLLLGKTGEELAAIRAGVPVGAVGGIEGPNEYDIFHDDREKDWAGKLRSCQRSLCAGVKADPVLKSVPVIGPSVTTHEAAAQVGDLSAVMDYGCGHFYRSTRYLGSAGWGGNFAFPPYGGGAYGSMSYNVAATRQMSGRKPLWATETGYSTFGGGISEALQAKYLPRLFAEFYRLGIRKTFAYELLDAGEDRNNDQLNFGLVRYDLSDKPAFVALKNLLGLLKDNQWDPAGRRWKAARPRPGALAYRLTGDTANVRSLLLQKRDGDFYLLLWQEVADPTLAPESWQPVYRGDVAVTLTLTTPVRSGAAVHVLSADGTMSKSAASLSAGAALRLSVPDRMMIVHLTPAGGKP